MAVEELGAVADLLARAFSDDPIWRFMAPEQRRWPRRMAPVFRHLIAPSVRHGTSWTTPSREGVAVWSPPGAWRFPTSAAIRSAPAMLRSFGLSGLRRSLRFLASMDAAHPRDEHWYLEFLATDSHLRGRGIGSRIIGPGLEQADEAGLPAYLESSKLENVPFYRRHGFEVVEELVAAPGAPPMWRMWRDPR